MNSKLRLNSRVNHPGVVQPRGRLGVFTYGQKKKPVLRISPQKQAQENNNDNDDDTEKQPISDFPSPPIPIFSCCRAQQGEMPTIPNLATAAHGEITSIVLQKMKLCQRLCDFSDPRADLGGKATKKATLNELIDLYTNQKLLPKLTRECHQQLIETFAANVFRSRPRAPRTIIVSDEVTIEDTAWPHLHLVYILFIKFLNCGVEQRILQYQLTPKFISSLFSVLDFPDARERVQVSSVIVTIYNKVPPQRTLLMSITLNLLMNVPENLELNAASHLLELFYQFTSNSPPPLSQQLIQAFDQVLLPLHLPTHCQRYFPSLVKCILLMIRKDARLINNVLHFLIEHWPLTLDHKTELFLDEISQILQDSNHQDLTNNATSLLNCVSIAIESPCTTLSEKALKFIQNNCIQNMIVEDPDPLLEIIFPPLFRVTCSHWQKSLQVQALNVMNVLMELTPDAFKKAAENFKTNSLLSKKKKIHKYNLWIDVLEVSAMNDSSIDVDVVAEGIKEFYNSDNRPPSRMSSSSTNANTGRSSDSTANNASTSAAIFSSNNNLSSRSNNMSSSRSNTNMHSGRSENNNTNINSGRSSSNNLSGRSNNLSGRSNNSSTNMNSGRSNNLSARCENIDLTSQKGFNDLIDGSGDVKNSNIGGGGLSGYAASAALPEFDEGGKTSSEAVHGMKDDKFEHFSNPFKELARDYESNDYGLFHLGSARPSSEFPLGSASALTVSEETKKFAQNHNKEKSQNTNQPDMLSIFGQQNNESNQPDMLSIFNQQNSESSQLDMRSIFEEASKSKDPDENQPNMLSITELGKNSDVNAIFEEENDNKNKNNTIFSTSSISESGNNQSARNSTNDIILEEDNDHDSKSEISIEDYDQTDSE